MILTHHGINSMRRDGGEVLPAGYTRLNYIQNTNNATYFNTQVGLKQNDLLECDCEFSQAISNTYVPFFGGRVSQFNNNYTFGIRYTNSWTFYYEKDGIPHYGMWGDITSSPFYNTRVKVEFGIKNTINYNNATYLRVVRLSDSYTYESTDNYGLNLSITTPPCYLFSVNNNGSKYSSSAAGKIYEFKITSFEGEKRAHLLPAKRDSDSVTGFYDIINNRFIMNGAGYNYHTYG